MDEPFILQMLGFENFEVIELAQRRTLQCLLCFFNIHSNTMYIVLQLSQVKLKLSNPYE